MPNPTTTWQALRTSLEKLRRLNVHGFRMGLDHGGEWLIGMDFTDMHCGPGEMGMTACSPAAVQAIVMAFASAEARDGFDPDRFMADADYRANHRFHSDLPVLFNSCAQGNFSATAAASARGRALISRARAAGHDVDHAANGYVQAVVAFGLGEEKQPRELRRGDCVAITWDNNGGHAAFAYDVHFNASGDADAVLVCAANGNGRHAGRDGYFGDGISILGNPGGLVQRHGPPASVRYTAPDPYLDDANAPVFVQHGTWIRWSTVPTDFRNTRYPEAHLTERHARLRVARLNGVVPPPGLCMDAPEHGDSPPPPAPVLVESARPTEVQRSQYVASPTAVAEQTRAPVTQAPDAAMRSQRAIEARLRALFDHGWLRSDPGTPDGINDSQTQAALREFQERHLHRSGATGVADAETRRELATATRRARHGEAPPDAPPAPPPAPPAPAIARVYWFPPSTGPSGTATLVAHGTGLDGRTLSVTLKNAADQAVLGGTTQRTLTFAGERASLEVPVSGVICDAAHATTLQIAAHISGGDIPDTPTEAPLRVESGDLILPPRNGKGLFGGGHVGSYGHDPAVFARELRAAGLDWILLSALDGGHRALSMHPTPIASLRTLSRAFREAGVEVWIWGWVYPCALDLGDGDPHAHPPIPPTPYHAPTGDALNAMIAQSIQTIYDAATDSEVAARGVVLDLEGGFAHTGVPGAQYCGDMIGRLTARGTTLGLGLSSFKMTGLHIEAMRAAGGFAMPQLYGAAVEAMTSTTRMHHQTPLEILAEKVAWFADQGWTKLVPTLPVWRQILDHHDYHVTPEGLTALMQHLRDNPGASELVSWSAWALANVSSNAHIAGPNADLARTFLGFH